MAKIKIQGGLIQEKENDCCLQFNFKLVEQRNTYTEVPILGSTKIIYTAISTFNKIFIYSGVVVKVVSIEATKNNAKIQVRREWKWKKDERTMTFDSNDKHGF